MSRTGKVDPFKGGKTVGLLRTLASASIPQEQKNQAENAPGSAPGYKKGKDILPNR